MTRVLQNIVMEGESINVCNVKEQIVGEIIKEEIIKPPDRCFFVCVISSKLAQQEDIRSRAVCELMNAAKWTSDDLQHRVGIAAFLSADVESLCETHELFSEILKAYLENTETSVRLQETMYS